MAGDPDSQSVMSWKDKLLGGQTVEFALDRSVPIAGNRQPDQRQRVEYEALLTVCFACGKYQHVKETCPSVVADQNSIGLREEPLVEVDFPNGGRSDDKSTVSKSGERELEFGPWMLVEKKSSRLGKKDFSTEVLNGDGGLSAEENLRERANRKVAAASRDFNSRVEKNDVSGSSFNAGYRGGVGLGSLSGSVTKENLGSGELERVGRMSKASLGKRPLGIDANLGFGM
ncbi:hypothetical protein GOBAR_AA32081 [Gossypium barbadense]|uniref:CCHC-type domain-containing protein n=1 Tax=Gossypium barbadense TaxID=3634 RepID=A0A2P5WC08_GOSBA|nr:hypothetical protein GOBAR_AA32081 [Gossypium barbadense]